MHTNQRINSNSHGGITVKKRGKGSFLKKWRRYSKKKKIVTVIIAVVVVIALITGTIFLTGGKDNNTKTVSVQETKVTTGNISNSIVGTGNLEVDASEEIQIPTGITIKSVKVESGDAVSKGDVLAKVDKISVLEEMENIKDSIEDYDDRIEDADSDSNQYKILVAKRKSLKKTYKRLKKLYKSGEIKATISGVVGDVNVSEGKTASNQSTDTATSESSSAGTIKTTSLGSSSNSAKATSISTSTAGSVKATSLSTSTAGSAKATSLSTSTASGVKATSLSTGSTRVTSLSTTGVNTENADQDISETTTEAETESKKTPDYRTNNNQNTYEESTKSSGKNNNTSGKNSNASANNIPSGNNSTVSGNNNIPNQSNVINTQNGNTSTQSNSGYNGSIGSQSGSMVVSATDSTGDISVESDDESYDVDEVTAFTLASNKNMMLSVNVDELDINSVEKGQQATITLDAIENKTFTGTVKRVSNSASSSGNSVAKYTVEITMEKDEQMKSGMNASATIIVENKENILTLPVNALQERGNQVFVYTKKDSSGNLSGEINVTTGLSDGTTVEITDGLSEGDTVYYQKIGNVSDSSNGNFSFPGGNGDFPGGDGNMPEDFDGSKGPGNMPGGFPGQGGQS